MIDPAPLWDHDDPAASEGRFRDRADATDGPDRAEWLTQVARALGLQERYADAHAVLDSLTADAPLVGVRIALERGRLHRSAGDPDTGEPFFVSAADLAGREGLDALRVDALHMLALVSSPGDAARLHDEALALARSSPDPAARDWDASLLNNIGMAHADAGDFAAALAAFEEALAARERIGDPARTRVARWMVAWALRHLDRREEALARQRALKAELVAAGATDPFVDDELLLLGDGGVA